MSSSNNTPETPLTDMHRLATAQLEGTLSDDGQAELQELLKSGREARRTYLQYIQDTVSLRWIYSGHPLRDVVLPDASQSGADPISRRRRMMRWSIWTVAAALAGVLLWGVASNSNAPPNSDGRVASSGTSAPHGRDPSPQPSSAVATVTQISSIAWKDQSKRVPLLSRVGVGDHLQFTGGTIELTFDTGAQVKVFGPASFAIDSPMSISCAFGRATTLVGESGKGFTIITPKARIVDWGTQFGVDISETGDTQVVVFQGSVDLSRNAQAASVEGFANATADWSHRLQQGDAMLVGEEGVAKRIVAVQRSDFFPGVGGNDYHGDETPLITDVRDNIRAGESTKCYQIVRGGFREDVPCFVDRSHQWNAVERNGLPSFLGGAEYIMPFNDDKFISDLRVEIDVSRPADCYVFMDDNMPTPQWLRKGFKDTGFDIGLDGSKTVWHPDNKLDVGAGNSIDFVFSIWRRDVAKPGAVVLGGVRPPKDGFRSRGFNMYGIAVAPK